MISTEEQLKILKYYLGFFYTPITKKEIQDFKKKYPVLKSCYINQNDSNLKKLGAYFLLLRGNEVYKLYHAYDIFNTYIGKDSVNKDWLDLDTPLIFIYYSLFTESNKKLQDVIGHIISHRKFKNLITIVLSEIPLLYIQDIYNSFDGKINNQIFTQIDITSLKSDNPVNNTLLTINDNKRKINQTANDAYM